ncbi:MAG: DJ-1/PfpI family protein [Pseudomonadota bacterium]
MTKIALILSPGFADWEYAFIAGAGGPFYGLDVGFFTPQPGKLTSQGGLECEVKRGIEDLMSWDPSVVAVIGGTVWETSAAPNLDALLKHQRNRGAAIAGICGGTLAQARAGLLDEIPHTSNTAEFLQTATSYQGNARYVESAVAVEANGIVTASGTAPASFAAEVFRLAGVEQGAVQQFRQMMASEH